MKNFINALGFFLCGTTMFMLPVIAPGSCPANGFDGSSTRELWLQTMGGVLVGVAVIYWMHDFLGQFAQRLARWPETLAMGAERFRVILPAAAFARLPELVTFEGKVPLMPLAFKQEDWRVQPKAA